MVRNPEVRAIFCARGGYGCCRIVPYLEPELLQADPKIICGASDVTTLLALLDHSGLAGYHGPMVATNFRLGESGYDRRILTEVLSGAVVRFPTDGTAVLRPGEGVGRLAGGCLSLLVATLGTAYEIDTTDAILVIEDIDTKPYQIDRMLTHLLHAGKFDRVKGVVFGEMMNCVQNTNQGYALEDVLLDVLSATRFPILFGFPTGHTSGPNVLVPFGIPARLSLSSQSQFELLEPAVTVE